MRGHRMYIEGNPLMKGFKTAQIARIVGVSGSTVRRWAADYADHLSATAQPVDTAGGSYARMYTDEDLKVLWTIHTLSRQGMNQDDIAASLAAGQLINELPPDIPIAEDDPVDMIPVSTALERMKSLQTRIDYLEDELDRERALASQRADRILELEHVLGDARAELARKEGELQAAELRGKMDAGADRLQGQLEALTGERRLLVRLLIAIVVVAAVLLAVVVLLALTGGSIG